MPRLRRFRYLAWASVHVFLYTGRPSSRSGSSGRFQELSKKFNILQAAMA